MARWFIGDMITGRKLLELPVMDGSTWMRTLNYEDDVHAVVPTNDRDVRALDLWNNATSGKSFIAVAEGDYVLAGGPLWYADYDRDNHTMTLDGLGMLSYFQHRVLMPTSGLSDPKHADSTWTNFSLGTIAKRIVQQSETWTGGNVPIVYLSDVADTGTTRTYSGHDVAYIYERLQQLTEVINGPDIDFMPRFQSDGLGVEWLMRTGTPTQPNLFSTSNFLFNVSVPDSPVSKLRVTIDGRNLAGQAWSTGGRAVDDVLISRSSSDTLLNAGFPLIEVVDSNHSDLSQTDTLQGYSDSLLLFGQYPTRTWSFYSKANVQPVVGSYNLGDYVTLRFAGDELITDGDYSARIVSFSGDARGREVYIQCQPDRSLT